MNSAEFDANVDVQFIEPQNGSNEWQIIHVKSRIDALSQDELVRDIKNAISNGSRKIALDLKNNRFMSFNTIRFCVDVARELNAKGGEIVLIGCAEKTKRHFEIYGTLKHIRLVRTLLEI
jgi:anti-anti-sigma factor